MITSTDSRVKPALTFNCLKSEQDRREWIASIRIARDILSQPALTHFSGGELSPGPAIQSDAEILDWVARYAETALHSSCTAKMGLDDMAVVHPDMLEVHGVQGLRVADASVMPRITNGNIYSPVMMIAERAADLIGGYEPLSPEIVPRFN